ncbi:MAG: 4'-phosphopantetheinyl transferase superfamily protein [Geminicoccaceae bacterium]
MNGAPASVTVWRVGLAAILGRPGVGAERLAGEERTRAAGFADALAAKRFVATRLALRALLARRLGVAPDAVPLATNPDGRTVLAMPGPVFSVAHSGDMALCALAARGDRLGVDLERLRPVPRALALAREVLGAEVARELEMLSPPGRATAFLAAWTRHEALVKAADGGLARALARPGGLHAGAGHLTCHAVPLPAGYVGAVAGTSPGPPEIRDFRPEWLDGRSRAPWGTMAAPTGMSSPLAAPGR